MRVIRRVLRAVLVAAAVSVSTYGMADAKGIEWCVKDPIFDIDGRVVRVEAFVPAANIDAPVHFRLRVHERAVVTWRIPPGESFTGTVTIERDDDVPRDTPRLHVRGANETFPLRIHVSGAGLRSGDHEVTGTSRGIEVPLRLVKLGR